MSRGGGELLRSWTLPVPELSFTRSRGRGVVSLRFSAHPLACRGEWTTRRASCRIGGVPAPHVLRMGTVLGSSARGVHARQVDGGPHRPPVGASAGDAQAVRPHGGPSTPNRGLEGPREPVLGRRRPSPAHFLTKELRGDLCVGGEVADVGPLGDNRELREPSEFFIHRTMIRVLILCKHDGGCRHVCWG